MPKGSSRYSTAEVKIIAVDALFPLQERLKKGAPPHLGYLIEGRSSVTKLVD